jgi:hypothetical protein
MVQTDRKAQAKMPTEGTIKELIVKRVLPIIIWSDWGVFATDFVFRIQIGSWFVRMPHPLKMAGSIRCNSYHLQFSNRKELVLIIYLPNN